MSACYKSEGTSLVKKAGFYSQIWEVFGDQSVIHDLKQSLEIEFLKKGKMSNNSSEDSNENKTSYIILPVDIRGITSPMDDDIDDIIGFICISTDHWGTCKLTIQAEVLLCVMLDGAFVLLDSFDFFIPQKVKYKMESWNYMDVGRWLVENGFDPEYFIRAKINGWQLRRLNEAHLEKLRVSYYDTQNLLTLIHRTSQKTKYFEKGNFKSDFVCQLTLWPVGVTSSTINNPKELGDNVMAWIKNHIELRRKVASFPSSPRGPGNPCTMNDNTMRYLDGAGVYGAGGGGGRRPRFRGGRTLTREDSNSSSDRSGNTSDEFNSGAGSADTTSGSVSPSSRSTSSGSVSPSNHGSSENSDEPDSYRPKLCSKSSSENLHLQPNQCNLIVNYLPQTVDERILRSLFATFGPIQSTRIVRWPSGKSKEYGFVKFFHSEDAQMAIRTLNGYRLEHKTLKVSVARKASKQNTNLFVYHLPKHMEREDLAEMFEPYGEILETRILCDRYGRSRGKGTVRFAVAHEAAEAAFRLNGTIPADCKKPIHIKFTKKHEDRKRYQDLLPAMNPALLQHHYNQPSNNPASF